MGGDLTRICRVLRYPDEEARRAAGGRLAEHASTLEELLGHPVSWHMAAQALAEGFERALGWSLETGPLTPLEMLRTGPEPSSWLAGA